jgi:hypothetical protein
MSRIQNQEVDYLADLGKILFRPKQQASKDEAAVQESPLQDPPFCLCQRDADTKSDRLGFVVALDCVVSIWCPKGTEHESKAAKR